MLYPAELPGRGAGTCTGGVRCGQAGPRAKAAAPAVLRLWPVSGSGRGNGAPSFVGRSLVEPRSASAKYQPVSDHPTETSYPFVLWPSLVAEPTRRYHPIAIVMLGKV